MTWNYRLEKSTNNNFSVSTCGIIYLNQFTWSQVALFNFKGYILTVQVLDLFPRNY
jgi:hypothetical protein